jgi:hypothetical protein
MSIKASNNQFPHDPDDRFKDKLDRGGYQGTAQDLKKEIDELALPDAILVKGAVVKTGNELSISALAFTCRIDQEEYTNPNSYSATIAEATEGYHRIDILVFTKFSTIVKIQGTEGIESAQEPDTPEDTIKISFISIFGSEIGDPESPVIGDPFVKKLESQDVIINYGATTVIEQINLTDDRNSISLTGAATDVKSIQVSGLYIRMGKPHFFKNRTGHPVKLWHLAGTGNIKYFFPNGLDLIVKPNEVIQFNTNANDSSVVRFEYVGGATAVIGAMTYKGSVANYAALPSTGMMIGDVYNLTDTGHNYAWSGSVWDDLGPAVDVSGKEDVSNKTQDIETNKTSTSKYASVKQLYDWAVAKFQAVLVSGTNIKTINSTSILGSGNLNTPDMDTTTPQDVLGVKTFFNRMFGLRNVANTFTSFFESLATASRTYIWPDKSGTVAMISDITTNYFQEFPIRKTAIMSGNAVHLVGLNMVESPTGTNITYPASFGIVHRQFRNSATTAGTSAYYMDTSWNVLPSWTASQCGFFMQFRVRINESDSLTRLILGIGRANTIPLNAEPSTYSEAFLFWGSDSTDANIFLYAKGGSNGSGGLFRYNTGFLKTNFHEYVSTFIRSKGSISTECSLRNITTGVTYSITISCQNPSNQTQVFWINNATSAIFVSFQFQRLDFFISD